MGTIFRELVRRMLTRRPAVRGRITHRQLPEADRSIPGIARYYAQLEQKPATFLDLLWQFEGTRQPARPRKRNGR